MSALEIPILELHQWIKYKLENSVSAREALANYLKFKIQQQTQSKASQEFILALTSLGTDLKMTPPYFLKNPYRRQLYELLKRGLQGQTILQQWNQLGDELQYQVDLAVDEHVAKLPGKLLFPLLLFILPAYLMMLLAPLTLDLIQSF
jgi:hypothetical protein